MPETKVTGVILTTKWDDDSEQVIKITRGSFSDSGPYVCLDYKGDATVFIKPFEWPEIRAQIDGLIAEIEELENGGER